MSTRVACRHDLLKRRIDNFFNYRSERKAARELLISLAGNAHAWIFGGMIRDIGLFGSKGFSSDIDVVISCDRDSLMHGLYQRNIHEFSINKLGGIRFRYHNIDIDIWCLVDTWAFREKLIPLIDEQSLLKTTLMSWDAVLYNLQNRKLISPENYLDDLMQRRLELVLDHTPNRIGALVKILRTIYDKQVDALGPKLCRFLLDSMPYYPVNDLKEYEVMHYQHGVINSLKIHKLYRLLQSNHPDSDLQIDFYSPREQLPLHLNER